MTDKTVVKKWASGQSADGPRLMSDGTRLFDKANRRVVAVHCNGVALVAPDYACKVRLPKTTGPWAVSSLRLLGRAGVWGRWSELRLVDQDGPAKVLLEGPDGRCLLHTVDRHCASLWLLARPAASVEDAMRTLALQTPEAVAYGPWRFVKFSGRVVSPGKRIGMLPALGHESTIYWADELWLNGPRVLVWGRLHCNERPSLRLPGGLWSAAAPAGYKDFWEEGLHRAGDK